MIRPHGEQGVEWEDAPSPETDVEAVFAHEQGRASQRPGWRRLVAAETDVEALAATVREALGRVPDLAWTDALAALTALLQHIETLTREREEAMDAVGLPRTASLADLIRHHRNNQAAAEAWKLVAAEAQVETLTRERDEALTKRLGGGDDYRLRMVSEARERMHEAEDRAEAAEAKLKEAEGALERILALEGTYHGNEHFRIARAALRSLRGES